MTGTASTITSRDGTEIAWFTSGTGPPLLLVHGALADHSRWGHLLPYLEPHFTVHAMDRRGRGASGDSPAYALAREYEDVAAVIDNIAERSGERVNVYANSFGGLCAFGAAALTPALDRLASNEGWPVPEPDLLGPPAGFLERAQKLLDEGGNEAVIEAVFRDVVGVSDDDIAALRKQPSWPARVAAAHTIMREEAAFLATRHDPSIVQKITVPALLLVGSESPVWRPSADPVAAAMPDARIGVLEGQEHIADITAPEQVAAQLVPFLQGRN
ncbi:MAG: alpha/beta hydrolase [Pararhodobacter sp.]|nr:alpha/beta hydrolase [Pararhodobacter sp.]